MARDVLSVRLSEEERSALERAARGLRLTVSEFLRRAGLVAAFRVEQGTEVEAEPEPEMTGERAAYAGQHVSTTYSSFGAFREESPYSSATAGWGAVPSGGSPRHAG